MAEFSDACANTLPVPLPAPGQLYGRPHAYGVANELERLRQGFVPPPRTPRIRARPRRLGGGPVGAFRRWWATTTNGPVDVWHRIRCRTGHHDIRGGHQMQLGNRYVFIERRCVWCDSPDNQSLPGEF